MRRLCWRRALALLGLAFAPAAMLAQPSAEPELMTWLVSDIPPYFSYPGGKAPKRAEDLANGEIDGFLRQLIKHIPQYRHEFLDAGLPRFEALVRQGQPICSALHVHTPERLDWLYFTQVFPPLLSRQVHLIVRHDGLAKFESFGPVPALADVLQRGDLVGLLPRDRSYGAKIDPLLKERGVLAPKTVVAGRSMHLLAMLRAGRMDYTLEYPSSVDEYLRGTAGPELLKLPLAEGRSVKVATIACGRSPQGRKRIEAIDLAVRKLAQDPQRDAWIRAWRGDALDEQDRLRLKHYMDERARAGAQIE